MLTILSLVLVSESDVIKPARLTKASDHQDQGLSQTLTIRISRVIGKDILDQEDETDGSGDEAEDGVKMSAAHRLAIAKIPSVVEWLSHALTSGSAR